jgi:hypothetical protein
MVSDLFHHPGPAHEASQGGWKTVHASSGVNHRRRLHSGYHNRTPLPPYSWQPRSRCPRWRGVIEAPDFRSGVFRLQCRVMGSSSRVTRTVNAGETLAKS